jgi:putative heme-binding domain-containing protein
MTAIRPPERTALAAVALVFCAGVAISSRVLSQAVSAGARAQADVGQALFATGCANCHGAAGKGGLGPPLADRNLSLETLRATILNGRAGTPMPPFKDSLDTNSLAAVIAYAEWLSSGGRRPLEPLALEVSASPKRASPQPISVGRDTGIPARGAVLFFDPTQMYSCRVCHSFADKGGPIGPDLAKGAKTPEQIYRAISQARVVATDYPAVALALGSGATVVGIESEETADAFVVFDLSSLPPVKRTVPKSQVSGVARITDSGIFDHTALPFTRQDRLDLSAYLGKADMAPTAK